MVARVALRLLLHAKEIGAPAVVDRPIDSAIVPSDVGPRRSSEIRRAARQERRRKKGANGGAPHRYIPFTWPQEEWWTGSRQSNADPMQGHEGLPPNQVTQFL